VTVRRGNKHTGPQPWDFRRPSSLSREHIRALQIAWETFGRQIGTVLTTGLRTVSTVTLSQVEQMTYDEYVNGMTIPSFIVVHQVAALTTPGLLVFEHDTAMRGIELLLGGKGTGTQPQRTLTEIESTLLRNLATRMLHELPYAFEAIAPLTSEVVALEANGQFAQIAAPSDGFVVARFEVKLGDIESTASMALPMAPLIPILDAALATGHRDTDDVEARAARTRLGETLGEVYVDVNLHFAPVPVPSGVVLDLAVGDVLPLRHLVTDPLVMSADGVVCARAVAGAQGKHLACLIVEPPSSIAVEAAAHSGARRSPIPAQR
jgi:flagellar motor switch protein FliM